MGGGGSSPTLPAATPSVALRFTPPGPAVALPGVAADAVFCSGPCCCCCFFAAAVAAAGFLSAGVPVFFSAAFAPAAVGCLIASACGDRNAVKPISDTA